MQSYSCQSWYFVWVFRYENEEIILPNLVLYLGFGYEDAESNNLPKFILSQDFWIRRCSTHPAKVGTLFEFLDRRCRAHPAKVGILSRFLDMMMQRISCQSWYFVEGFFI